MPAPMSNWCKQTLAGREAGLLKKKHNTTYKLFYWWNRWDFVALLRLVQSRAGFYGAAA